MNTKVSITIEFPDEEHMDRFLVQISDGAMENLCDIEPLNAPPFDPENEITWQRPFGGATKFFVEMLDDLWMQ